MKFPRPRILVSNEFPDLLQDQPKILQDLVSKIAKPTPNSPEDKYMDETIEFIKKKAAQQNKKIKLYHTHVGKKLFYVNMTIPPHTDNILCLVDTGASNSLLHYKIAKKLQLKVKPTSMQMATATGTSSNIIMGTCHLTFQIISSTGQPVSFCTNFIVARKLNGMQCILGAEFLLDESRVVSISATKIIVQKLHTKYVIPVTTDKPCSSLYSINIEYEESTESTESEEKDDNLPSSQEYIEKESIASNFNHNITQDLEDETLPPSEQLFDNTYELKFESLEKQITLEDADYSKCPPAYIKPLKEMLYEYEDCFSKSKLDLQTTTLYEAPLPTIPGRIVQQ
jgi:hypothetical protein